MAFDLASAHREVFFAHFKEDVIYYPRAGQSREITAVIDRNPPTPMEEVPGSLSVLAIVEVRNDVEDGITAEEVNRGGDQIEFALKVGEPVVKRPITQVLSADEGVLRLGVR